MKALVVDRDGQSRYLLQRHLEQWGYEVIAVRDSGAALETMKGENPPRLLLLDWEMEGEDSGKICRRLREHETLDPPYIIFFTAKREPGDMARALDSGASDCIRKPFDWEELHARIRVGERNLKLLDQLNAARREMRKLAMNDMLTGIYNRRAGAEQLETALEQVRNSSSVLTVGLVDMDHFKQINDSFGHQAGDAVLIAFVEKMRAVLKKTDVIARWGGDEFMVLVTNQKEEDATLFFERIRRLASEMTVEFRESKISFTVSIGVAKAVAGESAESLLHRADLALYTVKRHGRNGFACALPPVEMPVGTA